MIEDSFVITDLKFDNGELLINQNYVTINENSQTRLYYKDREEGHGFEFACIEITGSKMFSQEMCWKDSNTTVMYLFKGVAYFDGIRHIYFGIDKDESFDGYIHCPNINLMIKALIELKKLEIKYCSEL